MAIEQDKPIVTALTTSRALALFVADVPTEKKIDAVVAELAPDQVPVLVARATPIRKALQHLEKVAEARIAEQRIVSFGGEWVDPEQGVVYEFSGELREWSVKDPDGLAAGLAALVKDGKLPGARVARAAFATWKFNHTELNALRDLHPEARELIDDFRGERGFAPAHLKEKR